MANPRRGDKCANATAAMRMRVRRAPSCPVNAGHPVFRDVKAQSQRARNTGSSAFADDDGEQLQQSLPGSLRLVGGCLLAFGHELLALLAVDALGIGFL